MPIPPGLLPNPTSSRFEHQVKEWEDSFGMVFAVDYGNPDAEYEALRNKVVALEYSTIRKWFVEGPDAVITVDAVFSRDMVSMPSGRVAYGAVVDDEGFMIEDVTVLKISDEQLVMFGGDLLTQQQLENAAPAGTTVIDRRSEFAAASIQGPNSRKLLERLTQADVSNDALPYYGALTNVELAGTQATILRLGFTAELGYEIMVPVESADQLWDLILAQTDLGICMMGIQAILVARTEAGFVMGGFEYDRTTLPYECSLGWTLDLDKGDFQGRDALLAKKDSAPTRLVTVVLEEGKTAEDGEQLFESEKAVGTITMAVQSPVLEGKNIGLARVDKALAKIGTELSLANGTRVTIHRTPIFDPERTRVKS